MGSANQADSPQLASRTVELHRRMDRRVCSSVQNSKRSLASESESDVGSLLSGLSQARNVPDRRKHATRKSTELPLRVHKPSVINTDNLQKLKKRKIANYRKQVAKIIHLQAFARGYIVRFAYQSRLTMESTKRRFFAIVVQAIIRGFIVRQRYQKRLAIKTTSSRSNKKQSIAGFSPSPLDVGDTISKHRRTDPARIQPTSVESDTERSEVSTRVERLLSSNRMIERRLSFQTTDKLGESESEVGSIMSNLSRARRVPDRRRKQEEKESKVVKIQALARGYIHRFLSRSLSAMEDTKRTYAAILVQAYMRGYLQRMKDLSVSRIGIAQKSELLALTNGRGSSALQSENKSSADLKEKRQNAKKPKRGTSGSLTISNSTLSGQFLGFVPHLENAIRKPVRQRSGTKCGHDGAVPRQLTIRKPKRHTSDSEDGHENRELPFRNLAIQKPRRNQGNSPGIVDTTWAPRRDQVGTQNGQRGRNRPLNQSMRKLQLSPPRKVMLRVKKLQRKPEADLDASEYLLDAEKLVKLMGAPRVLLGNASESRQGESESDVGSLMSGLSKARRVPDRRVKRDVARGSGESNRNCFGIYDVGTTGDQSIKNATKIQTIGRGYIARFAFRSHLILLETKKKFFVIKIQALARGYLNRSKSCRQ